MEYLTQQEEEIMLQIWKLESCTVKQVLEQLEDPKPPYTTVASTINNLKRKSYVEAVQRGITYIYSPLIKQCDYKKRFIKGFVSDYFKNSFRDMVSFFAREQQITSEELKEIIDEIEKGKK